MREILFKGKELCGIWVEGNLTILKKDMAKVKAGSYISNRVGVPFACAIRPETVCQYTGLRDINSDMIFEGDIVKSLHAADEDKGKRWIVSYLDGHFRFQREEKRGLRNVIVSQHLCDHMVETYGLVVVGNIHDMEDEA